MDAEALGDVDGAQSGRAAQVGERGGVLGDIEELEGIHPEGFGRNDEQCRCWMAGPCSHWMISRRDRPTIRARASWERPRPTRAWRNPAPLNDLTPTSTQPTVGVPCVRKTQKPGCASIGRRCAGQLVSEAGQRGRAVRGAGWAPSAG